MVYVYEQDFCCTTRSMNYKMSMYIVRLILRSCNVHTCMYIHLNIYWQKTRKRKQMHENEKHNKHDKLNLLGFHVQCIHTIIDNTYTALGEKLWYRNYIPKLHNVHLYKIFFFTNYMCLKVHIHERNNHKTGLFRS